VDGGSETTALVGLAKSSCREVLRAAGERTSSQTVATSERARDDAYTLEGILCLCECSIVCRELHCMATLVAIADRYFGCSGAV